MKKILVALVLLVVALVVVASWSAQQKLAPANTPTVEDRTSAPPQAQMPMHEYAAKGRVPAYYETSPDISTLPPTLSPEIFTGNKRLAYQAAKEIPDAGPTAVLLPLRPRTRSQDSSQLL